jgi:hypothetical protein
MALSSLGTAKAASVTAERAAASLCTCGAISEFIVGLLGSRSGYAAAGALCDQGYRRGYRQEDMFDGVHLRTAPAGCPFYMVTPEIRRRAGLSRITNREIRVVVGLKEGPDEVFSERSGTPEAL